MSYLQSLVAALAALFLVTTAAAADTPFPRLAGMNIGAPQNFEDPAYQAALARYDVAVLTIWPGWEIGRNTTMEAVVKNIKSVNPNTKVFLYLNNNELPYPDTAAVWSDKRSKLDEMKWWLYKQGSGPEMVLSGWGLDFFSTNLTLHAPADRNGDRWVEWFARWAVQKFYVPNPSIDGFYLDNVFWKPRVSGDWNRDGKTDSMEDPTSQAWLRQGLRRHFDLMKQLMPGKYQIGNVGDWGSAAAVFPELDKQLHGGFVENLIGPSYAAETWGGWNEMMRWYRKSIAASAEPKLVMFNQWGDPTDYQAVRYGFASCLMDDGYFVFSTLPVGREFAPYRETAWFDEFDAYLGQAVSPPALTAWSQGVYRREFENGIVLVNPKGNGTRTVQLETDFRRISGTQDPSVNNGQLTRSVTLKDRDGIVLLKLQATPRPKPPQGVRTQ